MKTVTKPATIQTLLERFREEQVFAVIRSNSAEKAIWLGEQYIEAGFRILDVTYGTPDTEKVIRHLSRNKDVLVGAGTVMDITTANKALEAGASFLLSPALKEAVLKYAVSEGVLMFPGVTTPTEIHRAFTLGAQAIKLFPAAPVGGAAYLKNVRGPFPELKAVCTGGIHKDNFKAFLEAGALAVGFGESLIPVETLENRDVKDLQKRVRKILKKLKHDDETE